MIRTQEAKRNDFQGRVEGYITIPFHFIMERRMLLGIKDRAEKGETVNLSQLPDIVWFMGISFSAFLMLLLVVVKRGMLHSVVLPTILSLCWLFILLLLPPIPMYSTFILLVVSAFFLLNRKKHNAVSSEIRNITNSG